MGTIPTGQMERKLRGLYLRFVSGLKPDDPDVQAKIASFGRQAEALIAKEGGNVARLGAVAGFPAPKLLQLSPYVGKVYDQMQLATIQAGLAAGQGSKAIAQAMFKNGMDKSYRQLERLARTETTSAYWKNTWDSTATLPGIVLLWSSETSPRTCHWCQERDGLVVDDPNIRDHPNGRCTLVPTARSLVEYRGTLQRDGSVVKDPNWGRDRVQAAPVELHTPALDAKPNPAAPSVAQPAQASAPVQPTPQAVTEVRTFGSQVPPKVKKSRIESGDWRYVDDRNQRAAVLLQNDYRAEQAIKKMAKAIQEGSDPKAVRVPSAWTKEFTGTVTDVAGARYTEAEVKDALLDAAKWLVDQEPATPRVMYKGLDVPKEKIAKLFKEGAEFDTNFSSFSTSEDIARGYSSRRATQQVIVRVKNKSAIKVDGNPTAAHWKTTKEHLVSGKGRVTKVTEAHNGRTVYVDVEF